MKYGVWSDQAVRTLAALGMEAGGCWYRTPGGTTVEVIGVSDSPDASEYKWPDKVVFPVTEFVKNTRNKR